MAHEPDAARDPDPATLARYLSGEADRDECARVERWIAASPEHQALVEAMRAVWERPPVEEFDPDDAVWRRIQAEIAPSGSRPTLVTTSSARSRAFQVGGLRRPWRTAAAAAAIAVIAAGAAVTTWRVGLEREHAAAPTPPEPREIVTRRGERLALRLADGTRVVLAAESRLRLPQEFSPRGRTAREVQLEGEAFFEVVHDSTRPFRVHTPNGIAEDLGTEFVVTSYPETRGMRVVVASGLVALRRTAADYSQPAPLTLARGDLGTMDPAGATTLERGVNVQRYVSWAEGRLVFDGTPLGEAVPALRRWYDVDLRLGDPALAGRKLTATFRDEPISEVLKLVAMSLDLRIERRGDAVTLR